MSIYIDANIFIHAVNNAAPEGIRAQQVIFLLAGGRTSAITSFVTIDEVMRALQKINGREAAARAAEAMLHIRGLQLVGLDLAIISEAIHIYKHEGLRPRDAIHLATMREKGITAILSTDADFDKIPSIKRVKL